MELISELTLDQLIIKPPIQVKSGLISEVWYKKDDGAIIKPIFQTPRLKVVYSANKFQSNTYSYCVSLHNADIDEEIECFFNLISTIDQHIIESLPPKQIYKSAMSRKKPTSDYYMRLKIINDGTVIKNMSRKTCCPADITYGTYADQYIGLDILMYTPNGVIPMWNAHQIVISQVEKVFLSTCLLDTIAKPVPVQADQTPIVDLPLPVSMSRPRQLQLMGSSPLGQISLSEILNFKLKKTV
jgi:hypothetical protein